MDAFTGLLAVAICVRLLGVSLYGVLAFLFSLVALVAGLSRLGWGVATTYAISASVYAGDSARASRTARAALGLASVTGSAGAVVVTVAAVGFGSVDDPWTRLVVGLSLGTVLYGSTVGLAASSIARALGRVPAAETPVLVMGIVRLGVLVALAPTANGNLRVVSLAYGVAGLATLGVSLVVARRMIRLLGPGGPGKGAVRELAVAAGPFAVQGVAALVITRFDVLVLGVTAGSSVVGAYEPTLRATERVMQLVALMALAQFLPVATSLWGEGDDAAFRRLYQWTTKLCYLATMLGAVVLTAFPEPVMTALYGHDYPVRPAIVWVLMLGYLPYAALAPSWHALAAVGERRTLVVASVATFATMVVAAVAVIPSMGALGAAFATALSLLVLQVVMACALWRRARVHAFDPDMVLLVVTSVILLLLALTIRWHTGVPSLVPAVAWSAVLWATWAAAVGGLTIRRSGMMPRTG